MKLFKKLLLSTMVLGAGVVLATGTANAADTDTSGAFNSSTVSSNTSTADGTTATGKTTAKFAVTAGDSNNGKDDNGNTVPSTDNGALKLVSAPSFDFGTLSVKDLTTNTSKNLTNSSTGDNGSITNNKITVSDYRGYDASKTWAVSAKLGTISNGTNTIDGNITIGDLQVSGSESPLSDYQSVDLTNGGTVFTSANAATNGAGTATASVTSATLNINGSQKQAVAGNYSGDITWTLSNTASTDNN